MMLKNKEQIAKLKQEVYEANMLLYKYKLAIHTWGNVSAISEDRKFMAIKPSGIAYETMTANDMVLVDLDNNLLENKAINPSSDTPTHALLYKQDSRIKAIVHTHSPYAVAWAQAGQDIPCLGTTHADNFYGSVPCARELSDEEINGQYEHNTGLVIVEHFLKNKLDFIANSACLVKEHGPFVWSGKSATDAVNLALTLEEIAKMALFTKQINPNAKHANLTLQNKHYQRKHGKNAYYGQKRKEN
ncbi:L-ribulose-5-phosphate 4-epimerase [Mycoplasma hyorhinis]|uniref:L-ribulose-5-phosphate 4-epimerase n=1 Tax=Mesomycoplasma hyorhinis TaxID=2100 RepID=UPI00136CD4E3|nr:L-ribulose-5-phosphate 4-epimerase [Mesomycoplasma hyorhinis]MXR08144.1 L-ribulose-5-phosphate 4-epimerase [Mesomycoplasma hyorhinis]